MKSSGNLIETELIVDRQGRTHLDDTATWAKFVGVMGFVFSLVMAAAAGLIGYRLMQGATTNRGQSEQMLTNGVIAITYITFSALTFYMSLHLARFAKKVHAALQTNDQFVFTEALRNLRRYFRFAGLITALVLVFTLLAVINVLANLTNG